MQEKWDRRFLELAQMISLWSRDPSTQCGAVIVRPDKTIASVGFNGFPKGCSDDSEYYENRELKYERVVHAELNAILHAKEDLSDYTIYTWPPGLSGSCARCTAHIIQSGIKRIVHIYDDQSEFSGRWSKSAEIANEMCKEAGVKQTSYSLNWWNDKHI